ncbi:MAG: hypothetical protein ACRDQA_03055 [Nocardioidaceae bacterium]
MTDPDLTPIQTGERRDLPTWVDCPACGRPRRLGGLCLGCRDTKETSR